MAKTMAIAATIILAHVALALAAPVLAAPATTAASAETFVGDKIQQGLAILNNKQISAQQRQAQFQTFLLDITDMRRIGNFTLGQYRRTASPADLSAFEGAFQIYAVAIYRSYFSRYAGQTLMVTGSIVNAPGDFIIHTNFIDPSNHGGQPPLEVDFRVLSEQGKLVVVDIWFSGISLAIAERDEFVSFLGKNNGNIHALISHLVVLARQLQDG